MMGGKKEPEEDSEPPDPSEMFTPMELLPWFAKPEWVANIEQENAISKAAAKDFLANIAIVPGWALTIAPLKQIRRIAN